MSEPTTCEACGRAIPAPRPKREGMLISLPGVLVRAAAACERSRSDKHLAGSLELLLEHLRLVRADPSRIGEFFDLWVDEGGSKPGP